MTTEEQAQFWIERAVQDDRREPVKPGEFIAALDRERRDRMDLEAGLAEAVERNRIARERGK